MAYRRETAGGVETAMRLNRETDCIHGDLMAIRIINARALIHRTVSFEGKKHLWNMQSRLISRVAKQIGVDNPNSIEGQLLRELIGLASRGI